MKGVKKKTKPNTTTSLTILFRQAIGARNLLKSIAKQREAQEQQLQALIAEKKMQLERYRIEYETLCKIEADQNEFIDQFIFQK